MDILKLLDNNSFTLIEKRNRIADAIKNKTITIKEIQSIKKEFDDKKLVTVLEAMEATTRKNPEVATSEWIEFVQEFINSESNNLKREASRVIGNIAHLFPNNLEQAIEKLMINTKNDGTVIRWGSAYAFARIIIIPQYATSELFIILTNICDKEEESGVKNQLIKGIKKAKKLRE